ncbi:hypothetical protein BGS_1102 [Beggiatoa sp. SS]|nr:hypothetical protein BGS_1102 [Beggiatoa sp. SS]
MEGDRYEELRELLKLDIDDNSVPEYLENVIKANSHVVKELYEKLGQLPNPIEIKADIQGLLAEKTVMGE